MIRVYLTFNFPWCFSKNFKKDKIAILSRFITASFNNKSLLHASSTAGICTS